MREGADARVRDGLEGGEALRLGIGVSSQGGWLGAVVMGESGVGVAVSREHVGRQRLRRSHETPAGVSGRLLASVPYNKTGETMVGCVDLESKKRLRSFPYLRSSSAWSTGTMWTRALTFSCSSRLEDGLRMNTMKHIINIGAEVRLVTSPDPTTNPAFHPAHHGATGSPASGRTCGSG